MRYPASLPDIVDTLDGKGIVLGSRAQAERWLRSMARVGLSYHPDDDPRTVVTRQDGEWVRTFTDTASNALECLMSDARLWLGDRVYTVGRKIAERRYLDEK